MAFFEKFLKKEKPPVSLSDAAANEGNAAYESGKEDPMPAHVAEALTESVAQPQPGIHGEDDYERRA